MFNDFSRRLPAVLFAALLGTCGFNVVRHATAAPVTVPQEPDVKKADRTAVSRVGGQDVKAPLPEGGVVGGNGVVEPADRETKVAAQVTALVDQVLVQEGARVQQGQTLVRLNDAVERAQLAAAEAELNAEKASLQRTMSGLRLEDRDASLADSEAARARVELSAGVLQRTEQLFKSGAATQDELDRARRQADLDRAGAAAAMARLKAATSGRGEDVLVARARVQAAEARLAQARAVLERLTVKAPLDGEVLQVKVRPGELYSFQGQTVEPLVVLGDTRTLRVRMDVSERDIAHVAVGAAAHVTADAFGSRRFTGKVVEVARRFGRKNVRTDDPVEKNDTKVLEVVIQLDSNELLVPGQRVTSFVAIQPARG